MSVLSEAITSNDHKSLSCFAECIVLASLHGRCLTLRRLAHAAAAADMNWRSAWSRVERLTVVLEKRADRLLQATPPAASILVERDPMLVFSHILAQNAIIHLYHTSQPLPFQPEEYTSPVAGFSGEQRAYQAAVYTAHMALSVPSISCFKVCLILYAVLKCFIFLYRNDRINSRASMLFSRMRVYETNWSSTIYRVLLHTLRPRL